MYKSVRPTVDFPALENEVLRFWEDEHIFAKLVERNRGNARYSFIDGPITANNPMGVHHAWGRTYKDIYQRYKAMKGFDQRYQNGFDCQGLWVEVEVERALGLNSKRQIEEYGLDRFAERCRERVLTYADTITKQSVRLGQWMHWDDSYFTMTDNNIEHIWYFLKRCQESGWLYKGWRTMPWCARCGTSLSQHELIGTDSYRDVIHQSVTINLPIVGRENEHFLVWTTTPWTLPANVALAVHPDLDYARVERDGQILYLSARTVERVFGGDRRQGTEDRSATDPHPSPLLGGGRTDAEHSVLSTMKGAELVGLRYRGPFDELDAQQGIDHRVVPWDDVGEDEGTGIVHIAPGCGAEDFTLSQVHDLPVLVPIDENGEYYAGFGELAGKSTRVVRDDVFGSLRSKNMLFKIEDVEHRYPTCWRCGEEIVFRGVSEWFISCDEIRPRMISAARTIDWIPASAGKRMEDWLNNMGHWCISRKRYWGLPLPFFPCPKCDTLTVVGSVEELRNLAVSGMNEVKELHRPWIDAVHIRCPSCGEEVERITEVGDCWLDAGIVPFSTLGRGFLKDHAEWERWYPADWVSEMREQIRLWFYSMLFMSVAIEDQAPYKRVLTYEKLMDETGHPMHKSLGNAIWFDEAAERMGADVMRWLYAGQSITSNLLFGYKPAEEVRRRLITLWNVYSFYVTYAEVEEYRPASGGARPHPSPLPEGEGTIGSSALSTQLSALSRMDRWIVSRLNGLVALANDRLDAYDVATLADATDRFVDDLSTWYLRRSRRRFSRDADPADRESAFNTLFHCLSTLIRVIAPIMPFVAEEIYQNIVRSVDLSAPASVHLTPFPVADEAAIDQALEEEMDLTRAIVTLGRAARSEAGTRVRQPLPAITIATGSGSINLTDELRQEIANELNVREVRTAEKVDAFARRVVRPNPRVLGPRLGAAFQSVKLGLQEGAFTINPDGSVSVAGQTLSSDEVAVTLEPLDNQTVAQDMQWHGGLAVALDRSVTPELRAEGLAREVVHRVQMMRRDAGLNVEDRISLDYRASPGLTAVLETHGDRIKREVGAVEFRRLDSLESTDGPDVESAQARIDGEDITLSLRTVE